MGKDFEFTEMRSFIENDLGKTERVDVYLNIQEDECDHITYYSAFVKNKSIKSLFRDYSRDLMLGDGKPGYITTRKEGIEINKYYNYNTESVYPIVFYRSFSGLEERYFEPLQEFCHFFDLYEDKKKNIYYAIDELGDLVEVIKVLPDRVSIKLKFLKDFAAAKKASIVIFFDAMIFSRKGIKELGISEIEQVLKEKDYYYRLCLRQSNISEERVTQSWLLGKKIVPGTKDYIPDFFGKNKKYEEFIIGVDADGNELLYSCNKEECANRFGKNKGKPDYLTPVCFKKEVLKKYYDSHSKYSVEDGIIFCQGLRSLRIDNNHDKYVVVFLGDLGSLPHKEQLHWKHFNVIGERKLSYTCFQRSFMAEFANPEQPDLYFKYIFEKFQQNWFEQYGYYLFLPLSKDDLHYYKTLHTPLTNEAKEFEEQVLSLCKITIDSINQEEIYKRVLDKSTQDQGLDKLGKFLLSYGFRFSGMIEFLRNLQQLRSSGVAHRKGAKYEKIKKVFCIEELLYDEIFNDILIEVIKIINTLQSHLITKDDLQ